MLKFEVRSYHAPRWIVPILALAALALIPFALVLVLGLAAAAIGFSAVRAFLPPTGKPLGPETLGKPSRTPLKPGSVIDADYEIKDENEKEQHG